MKKDITELFYWVDEFTDNIEKEMKSYQLPANQKLVSQPEFPVYPWGRS